jgi:hypothetical protein
MWFSRRRYTMGLMKTGYVVGSGGRVLGLTAGGVVRRERSSGTRRSRFQPGVGAQAPSATCSLAYARVVTVTPGR